MSYIHLYESQTIHKWIKINTITELCVFVDAAVLSNVSG